ncbi:hypothetical protein [Marinifilum flexuosum]|uniref:hypothetical protein n=1 Tax=Marinifilum flexuosum TaxID=1117708 RepID=UPI002490471B|nr:hypothetical protein [Marinifilum flexuosum]
MGRIRVKNKESHYKYYTLFTTMKINLRKEKVVSFLKELTIVTTGVLIALVISNFKENYQVRKYHKASIETINSEVEANYSSLKGVIEKQMQLHDTLVKYIETPILIGEIFGRMGGLKASELSNAGLDLYKRNKIDAIDFKIMSILAEMDYTSNIVDGKLDRLVNFVYLNILDSSKESKLIVSLHIKDVLNSEKHLLKIYKDYIDKNIETENNKKLLTTSHQKVALDSVSL